MAFRCLEHKRRKAFYWKI